MPGVSDKQEIVVRDEPWSYVIPRDDSTYNAMQEQLRLMESDPSNCQVYVLVRNALMNCAIEIIERKDRGQIGWEVQAGLDIIHRNVLRSIVMMHRTDCPDPSVHEIFLLDDPI